MVDHKLRDLIVMTILKKKLEKLGNKVFFCRNGMELPVAIYNEVDTVILTQVLTKNWKNIAINLKKYGCNVVSLPSEGNPYTLKMKTDLATGKYLGYDNFLDLIFVWRKNIFDLTIKKKQLKKNKIIYSGFHRLISYTNLYKEFRKKIVRNYKVKNKTTILFVSNFNAGDYIDYPDHKFKNEVPKNLARAESIHRKLCIEFIKNTLNKYKKEINIIIKIHPYEKPDIWIDEFKSYKKNVSISIDDYIEGVIEQSDIIIGRDCHTMFESLLLDKIILNLSLKKNIFNKIQSEKEGSFPRISSIEHIKKYIVKFKNKKFVKVNKKILYDFRFRNKKLESIDIVVNNLQKLNFRKKMKLSLIFKIKQILKYLIFVSNDYFFHDLVYLKNKRKKIFNKKVFIDYRNRIGKHYHNTDIKFIEKKLP